MSIVYSAAVQALKTADLDLFGQENFRTFEELGTALPLLEKSNSPRRGDDELAAGD
ncbi:hypothetical protein KGY79_06280 [Candidatus Bipolaricaulota bacterium]|nr:hypothetical protein [Candidatus Bipolaricaulota bacterium]